MHDSVAATGGSGRQDGRRLPFQLPSAVKRWYIHLPIALILIAGIKVRLDTISIYHQGDMSDMLAATYSLLTWPPTDYYHNYAAMPWVYNHLLVFPMILAPFYWLFENVLMLPTAWAAKLLGGVGDLVIAILLYRQAGGRWPRLWGTLLAGAWLLAPWVIPAGDHPISVAAAFALLSLATIKRAWLSGIFLALGIATRSEIVFIAAPIALHFLSKRGLAEFMRFSAFCAGLLALIAIPFAVYDLAAMDYALRTQIQRDASDYVSVVSSLLLPHVDLQTSMLLQENTSFLAIGLSLLTALLAIRDGRVARVVLASAIAYLLTLPLPFDRYMVIMYAVGLYYAAAYSSPVIAATTVVSVWLGGVLGMYPLILTYLGLVLSSLLRPENGPVPRAAQAAAAGAFHRLQPAAYLSLVVPMLILGLGYGVHEKLLTLPTSPWAAQNSYVLNLLEEAKWKRLAIAAPEGTNPDDYVHMEKFDIEGRSQDVIFMHPISSASTRVQLPRGTKLQFAVALKPEAWGKPGDGVDFQVEVRNGSESEIAFSRYVDPKNDPSDRRWIYASVDMDRFAGEEIDLVLKTLPHSSADFDWAGWASPRLVTR